MMTENEVGTVEQEEGRVFSAEIHMPLAQPLNKKGKRNLMYCFYSILINCLLRNTTNTVVYMINLSFGKP